MISEMSYVNQDEGR